MRREKKNQIIRVLAERIRGIILNEGIDFATLQEIRLREGQPLVIRCDGEEKLFAHIVTREELRETMEYIANYSLYAYEEEMKQGFLTIGWEYPEKLYQMEDMCAIFNIFLLLISVFVMK